MTRGLGGTRHPMVVCLLLVMLLLGLAACGGSTTVQCPPRPASSSPQEWVQAPGEVAMALAAPVFGTDEYVQAAVFNHTQVILRLPPVYNNCAFFTAERFVGGVWQTFNTCRRLGERPGGGNGGDIYPGGFQNDQLKVFLSPGTYRLKQAYAIYPANPENVANLRYVYSLSFQVCVCARCA
ncbi:MAG: hypothetical protein ACXWQR_08730 [Ktedonobacterales bacterium]